MNIMIQLDVWPDLCIKPILQSGYIKEDSRPNLVLKPRFRKESIRVFSMSFVICEPLSYFL